jgi:hypothetical protein
VEQQKNSDWWSCNWKWFVPVAGLIVIVLFIGFGMLLFSFSFGIFKSSDVYKEALEKAKSNPVVEANLGSPIKEGLFPSGNINYEGSSGSADISIPISGPKGSGTIYAEASKSTCNWRFSRLIFESSQTKQRTDLLPFLAPVKTISDMLKTDPNFKVYPIVFGITVGDNGTVESFRVASVIDPTSKPGETPKTINVDLPKEFIDSAKKKAESKHYEPVIKGTKKEIFTYFYYSPNFPDKVITDWSKPIDEQP